MSTERSDTSAAAHEQASIAEAIRSGRAVLGIELGSTRIKACLIGEDPAVAIAAGSHEWENRFVDRLWTYTDDDIWTGLQLAYADLVDDVRKRYGVQLTRLKAIGVSAMMHGYLPFDADGELLVPFRTWRNTNTGVAAERLSELFGVNIPLRWSVAHLYQAVLDAEPHVGRIAFMTTLAGFVHWRLTGRAVLGVGDASGMFPIDPATGGYDSELLRRFDEAAAPAATLPPLATLLPEVLPAGRPAGELTAEGAALLDVSGELRAGVPLCPPEGDAGTGMVATNAVSPRTGNVSAGTSIFAMVVLERALRHPHHELDVVTTPSGSPVAMVHCNNGASELAGWAAMFGRFAAAAGTPLESDAVFEVLFREALEGEPDAGGGPQSERSASTWSSRSPKRPWKDIPAARNSSSCQPTPKAMVTRPFDSTSSVASCLARSSAGRSGATRMKVDSRIRLVSMAAAERNATGSNRNRAKCL